MTRLFCHALFLLGLSASSLLTAHGAMTQTASAGRKVTFTVTAKGTRPFTYQWYKNGTAISGAMAEVLQLNAVTGADAGVYTAKVSNSAGSTHSDAGTLLVVAPPPPVIVTQPVGDSRNAGTAWTVSVVATSVPAPTYQWRKNGAAIAGATGSSHTLNSLTAADAGLYSVVVANGGGSVTSQSAQLQVRTAPVVTQQPAGGTVLAGANVSFSVAATGFPAPTYQWRRNNVPISGATNATYTLTNVKTTDAASYTVVASNAAGNVVSQKAVLQVGSAPAGEAPIITSHPANLTAVSGGNATFSVTATGTPAPGYQWRRNGTAIPGATGTSLAIVGVTPADGAVYSVVVSNSMGSVSSQNATLAVYALPVFTVHPAGKVAAAGESVTFTAAATGTPAPSYQWRKNGVDISGATGASYTLAGITPAHAGSYTVVAGNAAGVVGSQAASLTLLAPAVPLAIEADFNADGMTDLLWQNLSTRECTVWLMNGRTMVSSAQLGLAEGNWQIEGTGDFNGDRRTDVLWRDRTTGANLVWIMSGVSVASTLTLPSLPVAWEVAGIGDFNRDGLSDIVWRNPATRENGVWFLTDPANPVWAALPASAGNRQLAGTGDFNSDKKSDIVWVDSVTLQCTVQTMDGMQLGAVLNLGYATSGQKLVGAGDFNYDGRSDMLWQFTTGVVQLWQYNGSTVTKSTLATVPAMQTLRN